jgi:hypothetical protein
MDRGVLNLESKPDLDLSSRLSGQKKYRQWETDLQTKLNSIKPCELEQFGM